MKYYILLWKSGHVLLPLWFFFSTFCPNSNTLISKLDTVYRYTVFNGKPVYGIFYTHIAYNKMVYQIILLYILKHSWESSLNKV